MDPQTARQHLASAGTGHPAVRTSSQARRLAVVVGFLLLEFGFAAGPLNLAGATAPVVVGPTQAGFNLIVVPDGAWELYDVRADAGEKRLIRARSNDHGRTWTEPETIRVMARIWTRENHPGYSNRFRLAIRFTATGGMMMMCPRQLNCI
ncbi:MAG: hypothetical protein IH623_27895 [Verrucomicrobia bacterium]|nr:hypothetical protein [Verrucomicrobiota bacterium]